MRPVLWISAAIAAAFLSHASLAADVKAVLDACDNTPGCGYSIVNKNGDINGCSKQACFYCPNDGKRQCFQVREAPQADGKPNYTPGADNLLTNMGAAQAPKKPKLGTDSGIITGAPAVSQ
jgi:hypothetical protein